VGLPGLYTREIPVSNPFKSQTRLSNSSTQISRYARARPIRLQTQQSRAGRQTGNLEVHPGDANRMHSVLNTFFQAPVSGVPSTGYSRRSSPVRIDPEPNILS
jgi:hypothetical protein